MLRKIAFLLLSMSCLQARAETLTCQNFRTLLSITSDGSDSTFTMSVPDYTLIARDIPKPAPESLPKTYTITEKLKCHISASDSFLRVCENDFLHSGVTLTGAPDGQPHVYPLTHVKIFTSEQTSKYFAQTFLNLVVETTMGGGGLNFAPQYANEMSNARFEDTIHQNIPGEANGCSIQQ